MSEIDNTLTYRSKPIDPRPGDSDYSLAMRLFGYGLGLFIGSPIIAMLAVMLLVPPFLMLDVEPDLVFAGVLVLGVAGMAFGIVFMVASPLTALLRTGRRG